MYEHAADAGYNFSVEYHLPWLTNHYGKTLFACRCEDGYTGYDCSLRKHFVHNWRGINYPNLV